MTSQSPATPDRPATATASHPDAPRRRQGCSCTTFILYGVLVLAALLWVGYHGLSSYLNNKARSALAPTELAEYDKWLDTPQTVPDAWLNPHDDQDEAYLADRLAAVRVLMHESNALVRETSSGATLGKMLRGEPVPPEELDDLTSRAAPMAGPRADLARLAALPHYSVNGPDEFGLNAPILYATKQLMIHPLLDIYQGRVAQGIEGIDDAFAMLRYRPPANFMNIMIGQAAAGLANELAQVADRHTTDPAYLHQLLQVYNARRTGLLGHDRDIGYHDVGGVLVTCMMRDGFITRPDNAITPREISTAIFNLDDYGRWIRNDVPAGDQHRVRVEKEIADLKSAFGTTAGAAGWMSVLLSADQIRKLQMWGLKMSHETLSINNWKQQRDIRTRRLQVVVHYDLARLWLARRMAELRGDPLPVTQSDFVPRYLPEWPADPHSPTGAGFQFDATTGEFYSIGPDATPATLDDITMEKLPAPTAAETTDTSDTITATESLP